MASRSPASDLGESVPTLGSSDRLDRWRGQAFVEAGQGFVEYGLILSLSALLAVILLVVFGGTVSAVLEVIGDAIDAAS